MAVQDIRALGPQDAENPDRKAGVVSPLRTDPDGPDTALLEIAAQRATVTNGLSAEGDGHVEGVGPEPSTQGEQVKLCASDGQCVDHVKDLQLRRGPR
jgi:hypothetical protein